MSALGKRQTVLLIDDSKIDLHVLLEMLQDHSFSVHVAFNGKDGLQKAELLAPDLILLDINMPVMDGFATCRQLKSRERTRQIPVIFLTVATDLDRRLKGLAMGAVDYICKPFHAEEVIARTQIHLELAQSIKAKSPVPEAQSHDNDGQTSSYAARLTQAAIDILRQSIAAPPNGFRLAEMIGTTEKDLSTAFKAQFSISIHGWIREERLRTARHLLIMTETPIASIAEHLGFSNQANFSKAFRLRFGFSPTEARNNARNQAGT